MSTKKIFFLVVIFLVAAGLIVFYLTQPANKTVSGKVYEIGLLQMASTINANMDGFKEGMRGLGYEEGKNVNYHYYNAEGNTQLVGEYAKKLVEANMDLIFTNSSPAAQAAKNATAASTIPVVFSMVADPVGAGFVASIQSSQNNLTGTSCAYIDIAPKRLEVLKQADPSVKKVMVFYRPGDKSGEPAAEKIKSAGEKLDIQVLLKPVTKTDEIKSILNKLTPGEVDALMDPADSMVTASVDSLVQAALRLKVPLMMMSDLEAEKGALVTYGVDYFDLGKQSARLAAKVLGGNKPSEIPIEMPRMFRMVVNMKTAEAIGLTPSADILSRANRVIR